MKKKQNPEQKKHKKNGAKIRPAPRRKHAARFAHGGGRACRSGRGVVLATSLRTDGNGTLNSQFGGILVERGRLNPESLEQALRLQQAEPGTRIGELLLRLGLVTALDIAQTLAAQLDLPLMAAADYPEFPLLEERVSTRFLRETHTLPVGEDETGVVVAMVDPTDAFTVDAFRVLTGRAVTVRVAARDDFEAAFERLYGSGRTAMGQIVEDIESVGAH